MNIRNNSSKSAMTMNTTVMTRLTGGISAFVIAGLLLFALPDFSEAQSHPTSPQRITQSTNGPTAPQPPSPPGPPTQTPIDGGLGLLLAAGGAYALRKMHKSKAE